MSEILNDPYRRILLTEVGTTIYEGQPTVHVKQLPSPKIFKYIHGNIELGSYATIAAEVPLAPSEVRRCAFRLILKQLHELGYNVPKHSISLESEIDECHQMILMLRRDGKVEYIHFLNANVLDEIFKK